MENTDLSYDAADLQQDTSPLNFPTEIDSPQKELVTVQDDLPMTGSFVDPNSPEKKRYAGGAVFNVAGTKYSVVRSVGQDILNWTLSTDPHKEWDVAWIDYISDYSVFSKLKPYQKISFFPGIKCLARKDQLGLNLMRLKKRFPVEYDFFPETFILPCDYEEFRSHIQKSKQQTVYIVKPQASCQGKGIFLTKTIADVDRGMDYVAQKYLTDPYLVEGLKFDMRIYVLLASCDPLKIYLYDDGLARFATEPYQDPSKENLADVCMHLTNYAINKNNPNFIFNNSASQHDFGHKRSIKALFKILKEEGHDVNRLWSEIKKIIIKTFCSAQPILAHTYKSYITNNKNSPISNCFQIFGFDIMLDKNLKPWLIEVNQSPSWTTDTPLDQTIKENVIKDALKILNISSRDRISYKKRLREEIEARSLSGKHYKPSEEQLKAEYQRKQEELDHWEALNGTGGYEKIFPRKELIEGVEEENYNAILTAAKEISPFRETSMYRLPTSSGDNQTNPGPSPKAGSKSHAMLFGALNKDKKQGQIERYQNKKLSKGAQKNADSSEKDIEIDDIEEECEERSKISRKSVKHNKTSKLNDNEKKKKQNSKKLANTKKTMLNIGDFDQLLDENVIPASCGTSTKSIDKDKSFPTTNPLPRQLAASIFERLAAGRKQFAKVSLHVPSDPSNAVHIDISNTHKMTLEKKQTEPRNSYIPKRFAQDSSSKDFVKTLASTPAIKSEQVSFAFDGAAAQEIRDMASPSSVTPKAKKPAHNNKEHQSYAKIMFGRETMNRPSTAQFGNYLMPKRFENACSSNKPRVAIDLTSQKYSWQKANSIEADNPRSLSKSSVMVQDISKKIENKH